MGKRALVRHSTKVSVTCSNLTTRGAAKVVDGIMLNCSVQGTCLELNQRIPEGSIVMLKAGAWEAEDLRAVPPEGFRMLSLAEVKWSRPLTDEATCCFAVGLKYLPD